jgi:hypothetical protein
VAPILDEGFAPPLVDGFRRFLADPKTDERVQQIIAEALDSEESDPHDSHPPLRERVAEARRLACPTLRADARPAIELCDDVAALERRLTESMKPGCKTIGWAEAVGKVWEPSWRAGARKARPILAGLTPARLPRQTSALIQLLERHLGGEVGEIEDKQVIAWATAFLGGSLCVALLDAGFAAESEPGQPVRMRSGELGCEPFAELVGYLEGKTAQAEWMARMDELGIAEVDLGKLG